MIANLVSEGQMERYSDLTIKQFVDSSADIRWCPYPDCGYAICMRRDDSKEEKKEGMVEKEGKKVAEKEEDREEDGDEDEEEGGAVGGVKELQLTCGENVECGQGHGFCWYVCRGYLPAYCVAISYKLKSLKQVFVSYSTSIFLSNYRNCMKDPHEPCSCELWGRWKEVVVNNMSGRCIQ